MQQTGRLRECSEQAAAVRQRTTLWQRSQRERHKSSRHLNGQHTDLARDGNRSADTQRRSGSHSTATSNCRNDTQESDESSHSQRCLSRSSPSRRSWIASGCLPSSHMHHRRRGRRAAETTRPHLRGHRRQMRTTPRSGGGWIDCDCACCGREEGANRSSHGCCSPLDPLPLTR